METVDRFQVGTPPVLGVYAVLAGAGITAEAGIGAIHAKGQALTSYAVDVYDEWLAPLDFALASPRDPVHRGAHVTFRHPQAWQLCQALKAAKVVPDFRAPDRLRIGLAPLYTRFVDVYEGFARLRAIATTGAHREFPAQPSRVT